MRIKEAIRRAEKTKEISRIIKNGGFLTSGFVTINPKEKIEKWNLSFYDPENEKITSVSVSEGSVKIGVRDKPLHKKIYEPDKAKIKVNAEDALTTAKKEFKKYRLSPRKILVSLQKREREFWNITFITKMGYLINVRIDAENGNVTKSEKINIFKVSKAS
ncbi:MAG: hypothetical protein J7K87_00780 [Candidatus Aenigmarchaeota archaeon]|nr:hypothetical protein [Candidatus Aenigmarchaeota archaeon]